MNERKSSLKALWPVGLALLAGCYAYSRRTRGYDRIAPELRSPAWRVRSPSLGPLLLPIARAASRIKTKPVPGVGLERVRIPRPDGSALTLYLYRPLGLRAGGPAMLYTHGGGMVVGSASAHHAIVSAYARDLGILVVSCDYRLAPEHPFPAALDDVHATYRWMHSEPAKLGIDPGRIAVAGESAGGGLTAALCQRIRDEWDLAPAMQVLIYPMLDDRTGQAETEGMRGQIGWTPASNQFGWSSYLRSRSEDGAPPEHAVPARRTDLSGLSPAWIGVGSLDLFHGEGVEYGRRLSAAGVRCEVVEVEGAFHAFDLFRPNSSIARAFREAILAAIARGTRGDA